MGDRRGFAESLDEGVGLSMDKVFKAVAHIVAPIKTGSL